MKLEIFSMKKLVIAELYICNNSSISLSSAEKQFMLQPSLVYGGDGEHLYGSIMHENRNHSFRSRNLL